MNYGRLLLLFDYCAKGSSNFINLWCRYNSSLIIISRRENLITRFIQLKILVFAFMVAIRYVTYIIVSLLYEMLDLFTSLFLNLKLLPLKILGIQFLNKCIVFERNISEKVCNFPCLYRSTSQSWDTFETFAENLELTLDALTNNNLFLISAIGDFNVKTLNRYKNDTTSYAGLRIDAIKSQFGLQKLIKEPTHQTGNSCIDLIFTSQPNPVMKFGFHSPLYPKLSAGKIVYLKKPKCVFIWFIWWNN